MGKDLVLAEKPSVGRDIAKVLGCTQKRDGYLEGERYIVTWAIGHLVTLCDPEEYDPSYKSWRYETLPIIPTEMKTKPIKKTLAQFKVLKSLMNSKEVNSIVCATDSGREGELIFRYIYEQAKCKKPFKRLWISSMTDTAIQEGFANLKEGKHYDALYISAKTRAESDWLVGMNASRAFTIQYNTLLSVGRVQTPTLAILVNREQEIIDFVPNTYWEVKADFGEYQGVWFEMFEQEKNNRIETQERSIEIVNKVKGHQGRITSIEKEKKKQPPPLLYDLTELQRDGNKIYGYSAKKTLSIAQNLYEKRKLITYPRTDSRYLSHDMLPKLQQLFAVVNIEPYKPFVEYIQSLKALPITKRIINDEKVTDHHAIIPTHTRAKIESLTDEEKKIYDLIVRRFLSVFFPYYEYIQTRVFTEVENETFESIGNQILEYGWKKVAYTKKPENEEEVQTLPSLEEGQIVHVVEAYSNEKTTKPPSRYTEAKLLSAMEHAGRFVEDEELKEQLKDGGLGTPATRAAIIERLLEVGYIGREKKQLIPTEKGMKLIDVVPMELKSPETTGKWEKGLSSIAKGKISHDKFIQSIHRYVHYIVKKAKEVEQKDLFPKEDIREKKTTRVLSYGTCPQCKQGKILENTKAFYCNRWKEGCKFTIWKNSLALYGKTIDKNFVKKLIKNKEIKDETGLYLPQTHEKCSATIRIKENGGGQLEMINVKRLN